VHWSVLPDGVAHLYRPGARPDVFADGLTYVALVPVGLTAPLGTHTRKAGRTWRVTNTHETWPLQAAEIVNIDDELPAAGAVHSARAPCARSSPPVYVPDSAAPWRFVRPVAKPNGTNWRPGEDY
jgi:uncharacterized protein YqjF (DUF2071 family)